MTKEARKAYLLAIRKRYRESDRGAKSRILDEFCEVCGYARKYAIRVLNGPARGPTRSRKRLKLAIACSRPNMGCVLVWA